ncbi:C4-dicarboxylate ABC transporter permease [Sulfurifustis variabilis]|uniref:TRAP transporter small permease protein n=1 Tax=Sulfurifustis variabilis TaxID=1675686 RepID=A0A1C7AG25_9GAMM|nr:TRAP transporter small permease subunit [Sulfurifustis variabilis]BAU50410.1 C4-dicarboxylate ABC transporter permease [Sulfurifustis variabilis]
MPDYARRRSRLLRLANRLSLVAEYTGRAVAWLALLLVAVVCYDVAMRYVFHSGSIALQELAWHLYALLFLLGAAYTLKYDGHVRVDIVYQRLVPHTRAWIDLLGALLFLLPLCVLIVWTSVPFAYQAFVYGEGSPDVGGLPYRYVLKSAIPLGFALLALEGVAQAARALAALSERRG